MCVYVKWFLNKITRKDGALYDFARPDKIERCNKRPQEQEGLFPNKAASFESSKLPH